MRQRGASEEEVAATVRDGERFEAGKGRSGFRRLFPFSGQWRGRPYSTKEITAFADVEGESWLVITVIVKYLRR